MSKKANITNTGSGYMSNETINQNFTNLNDQFANTISRDGSTPNVMDADFDLNGNDLLNGDNADFNYVDTGVLRVNGVNVSVNNISDYLTYYDTSTEAIAATGLVSGQPIIIGGKVYVLVGEGTYTANGDTVIDLTGSGLQAVLAPGERVAGPEAVADDTREADWFVLDNDASVFEARGDHFYRPVSSGEHLTTEGGVKLTVVPRGNGTIWHMDAFNPHADGVGDDTALIQYVIDNVLRNGDTLVLSDKHLVYTQNVLRSGFQFHSTIYVEGLDFITIDASNCDLTEDDHDASPQGLFTFKDCKSPTVKLRSFRGINENFPNEDRYSGFVTAADVGTTDIDVEINEATYCHGYHLSHNGAGSGVKVRARSGTMNNYGVTLRDGVGNADVEFAIGLTRRAFFCHGGNENVRARYSVSDALTTALRIGNGAGGGGPMRGLDVEVHVPETIREAGDGLPETINNIEFRGTNNELHGSRLHIKGDGFINTIDLGAAEGAFFENLTVEGYARDLTSDDRTSQVTIGGPSGGANKGLTYALSVDSAATDLTYAVSIREVVGVLFGQYTITSGIDGDSTSGQPMGVTDCENVRWASVPRHTNRRSDGGARAIIVDGGASIYGCISSNKTKGSTGSPENDFSVVAENPSERIFAKQTGYQVPALAVGERETLDISAPGVTADMDFCLAAYTSANDDLQIYARARTDAIRVVFRNVGGSSTSQTSTGTVRAMALRAPS